MIATMNVDMSPPKWRQDGAVFLWEYVPAPGGMRGWHVAAAPRACGELIGLIGLLRTAGGRRSQLVKVTRPTREILEVPNNPKGMPRSPKAWAWTYDPAAGKWSMLMGPDGVVETVFCGRHLADLELGLCDMISGIGDWALSDRRSSKDQQLWFWGISGVSGAS